MSAGTSITSTPEHREQTAAQDAPNSSTPTLSGPVDVAPFAARDGADWQVDRKSIPTPLSHDDALLLAFVAWFDNAETALRLGPAVVVPWMSAIDRATLYRFVRTLMAVDVASREDATTPKHDESSCSVCRIIDAAKR